MGLLHLGSDVITALIVVAACCVAARAQEPIPAEPPAKPDSMAASAEPQLIYDDGETLWESPTHGPPLQLNYLPPGGQIIMALRPADFATRPDADRTVAALGPLGVRAVQFIKRTVSIPLRNVDQLLVSWQLAHDGNCDVALVATSSAQDISSAIEERRAGASTERYADDEYLVANEFAYWRPKRADGRVLVIASPAAINDIIDLAGEPPPLRRDMERLLAHSDASRHATLLFAPSILIGEGATLFVGEAAPLRDALSWFLGDNLSAAAISLHDSDDLFLELTAVPTLDAPPNKIANQLSQRLTKTADRLRSYLATFTPTEYSRAILARLPDMLQTLATYTRHRADREHVILRCYLPAQAGPNLLLGAELTLAEASTAPPPGQATLASQPKSVADLLQRHTSLRFTKDTLEAALKMLAADVGVEITIRGPDLQLDGITKNQSFGIDLSDQPAAEILVQILRLANPDKTATGPADPKQKLVYVIGPKSPGRPEAIFITTRAAAKKRGEALPQVFSAK
jgi:hypothetical protein